MLVRCAQVPHDDEPVAKIPCPEVVIGDCEVEKEELPCLPKQHDPADGGWGRGGGGGVGDMWCGPEMQVFAAS